MVVWFLVIGGLGLASIVTQSPQQPSVLHAIDPTYAASYLASGGGAGFLVLGAVVLAITGAEALYADMGHFGPHPIRVAWYAVVYPALLLNYFGQGAFALDHGAAATHPFFQLAPSWALYPLVGLATAATVIASQALISGAFSLTHQAIQLGYAPRLRVVYTAKAVRGQIYMRSEEHTSELQSLAYLVCRLLLEKKKSTSKSTGGASRRLVVTTSPRP